MRAVLERMAVCFKAPGGWTDFRAICSAFFGGVKFFSGAISVTWCPIADNSSICDWIDLLTPLDDG